ncbi:thymidylate synthase, flavin-dependent [Pyrobaculum ferrireducens]|uniref:Flavin-dependent thymidylate synthase n=1 Tax=Pyrobaculum ferrireducens TaxID=1104324 RepID=G7VEH4_9CREN|nr:FAD-dependent thymidylate synthase [Pyrobaculum ferrireducens]AET31598.1 thymidylate synthase, flavin-dependent [Pyrobaculum ferrireducens]
MVAIYETPRVLLVGSWGSEALVSAFTDALYRGVEWGEAVGAQTGELVAKRISAFYRQGHWSVFEFMGAQFLVECSRACHTQFIRHRLASYWSESQRYVDYAKREIRFVVPRGFPADILKRAYEDYVRLRESFKPEYARMALPNAAATAFAVQMNARELLLNFVPLRCAYAAQAEIRHVCWQMFATAWRLWPTLARHVWEDLPSLHRDFCTKVPRGEDCRLYAIKDAEERHGPLPEKPWLAAAVHGP